MSQVYNSDETESVVIEDDSSLLYKLAKSEREKKEVVKKTDEERKRLKNDIDRQNEDLKEMRIQKDMAEKRLESLNKELEKADNEVRKAREEASKHLNLLHDNVDIQEEVLRRDSMIEDLERAKHENEKEIAGLKKISGIVE